MPVAEIIVSKKEVFINEKSICNMDEIILSKTITTTPETIPAITFIPYFEAFSGSLFENERILFKYVLASKAKPIDTNKKMYIKITAIIIFYRYIYICKEPVGFIKRRKNADIPLGYPQYIMPRPGFEPGFLPFHGWNPLDFDLERAKWLAGLHYRGIWMWWSLPNSLLRAF